MSSLPSALHPAARAILKHNPGHLTPRLTTIGRLTQRSPQLTQRSPWPTRPTTHPFSFPPSRLGLCFLKHARHPRSPQGLCTAPPSAWNTPPPHAYTAAPLSSCSKVTLVEASMPMPQHSPPPFSAHFPLALINAWHLICWLVSFLTVFPTNVWAPGGQ